MSVANAVERALNTTAQASVASWLQFCPRRPSPGPYATTTNCSRRQVSQRRHRKGEGAYAEKRGRAHDKSVREHVDGDGPREDAVLDRMRRLPHKVLRCRLQPESERGRPTCELYSEISTGS